VAQEVLEESGSDWDSDNDSDLEQARMFLERAEDEEAEAAEQKAFLEKGATASNAKMPEHGLYVQVVHRTAHRAGLDGCTGCGVLVSDATHEHLSGDDDFSYTRLCWRGGCAPWECADKSEDESDSIGDGSQEDVPPSASGACD
jgi:hypothetical protein